jgi:hypothetical protein
MASKPQFSNRNHLAILVVFNFLVKNLSYYFLGVLQFKKKQEYSAKAETFSANVFAAVLMYDPVFQSLVILGQILKRVALLAEQEY